MSAVFAAPVLLYTYEPVPVNQASTNSLSCNIGSSGAASFFPFILPGPTAVGNVNMIFSQSFVTVGAGSGAQSHSISYGLYSRGVAGSSGAMSTFSSGVMSWAVTGNNSSYTISQVTTTGTAGYTYSTTASAGSNITSGYTGAKLVQFPINTTLSGGQYWWGMFVANSTASVNVGMSMSLLGMQLPSTITALAPIGSFSTAFSTGTNIPLGIGGNWRLGAGSFTSAAQTNLPVSLSLSALTQDITFLPYMMFVSTR